MKRVVLKFLLALSVFGFIAGVSAHQELQKDLHQVAHQWHEIQSYPNRDKAKALLSLKKRTKKLASRYPGEAAPHVWEQIIQEDLRSIDGRQRSLPPSAGLI